MKLKLLYIYIIICLTAIVHSACQHDIDLDMDSTSGILCVNAILTADTTENFIYISRTFSNNDEISLNSSRIIGIGEQFTISVYINGNLTETSHSYYNAYRITSLFHEDDFVHIDIESSNGSKASFEGIVPKHIKNLKIDNAQLALNKTYKDDHGNTTTNDMVNITLSFDDDGGSNFYTLAIGERDSTVCPIIDHKCYDMNFETMDYLNPYIYETERYYTRSEAPTHEFYSNEQPPLTDEEVQSNVSDDDIAIMNIHNVYKIFSNKRFAGAKCNLSVCSKMGLPSTYESKEDIDDLAPYYYSYHTAVVTSISEDYYYYIKVLNTRESETYEDNSELTGPAKLPSNIIGGVGNIFLVSKTSTCYQTLNGWRPSKKAPQYYW
ncbi:MAG: DUF4249 family protein [Bacteroidales bacterium]|nr:DUF4249 family protein [Bacteroidales bacterium]